jgi:hypothetical protein
VPRFVSYNKENVEILRALPEPYVDTETGELIWSILDPELPDWTDQLDVNDPESSTLVELSPAVVSEIVEDSSRKRRRMRKD